MFGGDDKEYGLKFCTFGRVKTTYAQKIKLHSYGFKLDIIKKQWVLIT